MTEAMFGAGCFWGVESTFRKVKGVTAVEVGYAGGHKDNATYKEVCGGDTGHAEVVKIEFDPDQVSYGDLLEVFWGNHNPTTMNRQGPDFGSQYRSAIFTFDSGQLAEAEKSKAEKDASGAFPKPIITVIEPASTYWRAEDYHQNYFKKEGIEACPI